MTYYSSCLPDMSMAASDPYLPQIARPSAYERSSHGIRWPTTRYCAQCGEEPSERDKLKRCTGCFAPPEYCSSECQRAHWPAHRWVAFPPSSWSQMVQQHIDSRITHYRLAFHCMDMEKILTLTRRSKAHRDSYSERPNPCSFPTLNLHIYRPLPHQ